MLKQRRADSLMNIGDYQNALKEYAGMEESAAIDFKVASAYTAMGNFSKAIAAYEKGLKLEESTVKARFELGRLYLNNNETVKSLLIFGKLTGEFPENATYAFYKGQGLEQLRSEEQAMDVYENVLKLDPEYRRARIELVPLLIKKRETALAIKYSKEILEEDPDDIKFNSLIAQAYYFSRNYEKAIKHFEKLIQLGSEFPYNQRTLAVSYYEDTQWEKVIENFDVFLMDYNPKDAEIYFLKSISHARLQEYDEAQDAIEFAIAFKRPAINQEYLQLASIHAGRQDDKAVFNTLLKAQKEYPEDRIIAYQTAIAADRYFKDKSAIVKYYERFVDKFGKDDTYGSYASKRAAELKTEIFMKAKE